MSMLYVSERTTFIVHEYLHLQMNLHMCCYAFERFKYQICDSIVLDGDMVLLIYIQSVFFQLILYLLEIF